MRRTCGRCGVSAGSRVAELIERRARVGIELVDALTGGPILSTSRAAVVDNDAVTLQRSGRSRWFAEAPMPPAVTIAIDAEHYVSTEVVVTIPPPAAPGAFVTVRLDPRTGYPFPASLTRVVGRVVFDPTDAPVAGAEVTVTPRRGGIDDAPRLHRTTADGQLAAWFLPQPSAAPPIPDGYRIEASLVDGSGTWTGFIAAQPLNAHQRNDAPVVRLSL